MPTWLEWTLAGIAAWFTVVPLLFWFAMEVKDRRWPPKGLTPLGTRRHALIDVSAVTTKILEQMQAGKISPTVAEARATRVGHWARRNAATAPGQMDKFAREAMGLALALIQRQRLEEMPSPSAQVH